MVKNSIKKITDNILAEYKDQIKKLSKEKKDFLLSEIHKAEEKKINKLKRNIKIDRKT